MIVAGIIAFCLLAMFVAWCIVRVGSRSDIPRATLADLTRAQRRNLVSMRADLRAALERSRS